MDGWMGLGSVYLSICLSAPPDFHLQPTCPSPTTPTLGNSVPAMLPIHSKRSSKPLSGGDSAYSVYPSTCRGVN